MNTTNDQKPNYIIESIITEHHLLGLFSISDILNRFTLINTYTCIAEAFITLRSQTTQERNDYSNTSEYDHDVEGSTSNLLNCWVTILEDDSLSELSTQDNNDDTHYLFIMLTFVP